MNLRNERIGVLAGENLSSRVRKTVEGAFGVSEIIS